MLFPGDVSKNLAIVFFDMSSMLIPIIVFGKFLETLAKRKTGEAITKLLQLRATTALLVQLDKFNNIIEETVIDVDLIQKHDLLKVFVMSEEDINVGRFSQELQSPPMGM
jgi:cation transport ATPase